MKVAELDLVEVAVEHSVVVRVDEFLESADVVTLVVAKLVSEADLLEVAELLADRVAADVAMEVTSWWRLC